ncbi:hypothetical protein M408DRAFT_19947 [Serendipita vermifera MAFF 305830]|uniref:Uncharacterized protein n=1 Tax=Serendipita vermifera MAFF 305830 TaxID=933852 RepID=A0A0C2XUJ9_SERVB|nr:hypothetical protein M408DRAFT_19947 [Serendipita vermifera MAFF 305830]
MPHEPERVLYPREEPVLDVKFLLEVSISLEDPSYRLLHARIVLARIGSYPYALHPGSMSVVSHVVLSEGSDNAPGRAQSKYALFCKKCLTHNGLVCGRKVDETLRFPQPIPKSLRGEQHTPQTRDISSRLSASSTSSLSSLTVPAFAKSTLAAPGLTSRKGYRVEGDVDDTDGADGMAVVAQTPAAEGAKGRKSSFAAAAGVRVLAGIKRSGSGGWRGIIERLTL